MFRAREKSKGRKSSSSFLGIPHHVMRSQAWRKLNGWETKYLVGLMAQYNGKNNGDMSMTWTDAVELGWSSKSSLNNARKTLLKTGWIVVTRHGWNKVPTLYAVTLWGIDECDGKVREEKPDVKPLGFWKLGCDPRGNKKPRKKRTPVTKARINAPCAAAIH